jgi:AcrR family transcriptional regulator
VVKQLTKSERTRAAILAAARDLFAQHGYDRTTVRQIATQAEIDPALVVRYFGGKDALFALAVVFDLQIPDLSALPKGQVGVALARHYLELWEGESRNRGLPLLIRSAASNPFAAEKMREMFAAQVVPAIARVSGRRKSQERAALVASQLLGMAFCRHIIQLPPLAKLGKDELIKHVGKTLQGYIFDEM